MTSPLCGPCSMTSNEAVQIDRQRIFATGMSNGAILTYRLASELSDRIAAIAPVAGPMGTASALASAAGAGHSLSRQRRRICPFQGRQRAQKPGGHRLLLRGALDRRLGPGQRLHSRADRCHAARPDSGRHDRARSGRMARARTAPRSSWSRSAARATPGRGRNRACRPWENPRTTSQPTT